MPRAVHLEELQRLNGLRDIVVGDFEVLRLQIGDGFVASLGHRDVDTHQIRSGAKDRLLRRFGGGPLLLCRNSGGQEQNEDKPHTRILY